MKMRHFFTIWYAGGAGLVRHFLLRSHSSMKMLFLPGMNKWRTYTAKARVYSEFIKAKRRVPAYRDFLNTMKFSGPSFNGLVPNIHEIPITDKENYVKRFPMNERCVNGEIASKAVVIDESSGSSGTATNWARGKRERKVNARFIRFGIRNLFGERPIFIINAFALGSWATGINITMSCVTFSKVKSPGPDKQKIGNTLRQFGKLHRYIIMGYPPFLKMLVDDTDIDWNEYDVSFIFGGESMSEGVRDYLRSKGVAKIYSSFGASDLELNIAAENDFTISLRQLIRRNDRLREKLVKYPGALPMIFQFNPADFLIETTESGELIISICRPGYLAPKIRYNIHDRGHVVQTKELLAVFKELGIHEAEYTKPQTDLPLLFHYGRADMTVSFFGSNISPTDIQETIANLPEFLRSIHSFCMTTTEEQDGNKRFIVSMELQQSRSKTDETLSQNAFFNQLAAVNQDFKEARKMLNDSTRTVLDLHEFGKGPFANGDIRIKARYLY
jgi:phenylacetate-CoA ligase